VPPLPPPIPLPGPALVDEPVPPTPVVLVLVPPLLPLVPPAPVPVVAPELEVAPEPDVIEPPELPAAAPAPLGEALLPTSPVWRGLLAPVPPPGPEVLAGVDPLPLPLLVPEAALFSSRPQAESDSASATAVVIRNFPLM
jgi:hypothetical protein